MFVCHFDENNVKLKNINDEKIKLFKEECVPQVINDAIGHRLEHKCREGSTFVFPRGDYSCVGKRSL